jgi:hypothetical protein
MKIGVYGNCQSGPLAGCISALLPGYQVHCFNHSVIQNEGNYDKEAESIASCDLIFTHPMPPLPKIKEALDQVAEKTFEWTGITFTGFHPDIVYIWADDGKSLILSPMHHYNSTIIAGAFVAGRTPDETADLFNSYSYARLDYFKEYDLAVEHLERIGYANKVDLIACLPEWEKFGCFMYSINHPKMIAILSLARLLLKKAGVSPLANDIDIKIIKGDLTSVIWPVYPEISKRLDKKEDDLIFKIGERTLTLEQMIIESFGFYEQKNIKESLIKNERIKKTSEFFA